MRIFILATLMLSLIVASTYQVHAKVYKWKDDNGKWHYTDNPSKIPPDQAPKINRPPTPRSPTTSHKSSESLKSMEGDLAKGMGDGFQKMGEALGKGMEEGMQKMGEAMGKAFEGMGELIIIAAENKPDEKKKSFANKEEQVEYKTKEVLLGMFMLCQFQYIVAKSKICTKEGPKEKDMKGWKMKDDPERKKKLKDYFIKIFPDKNTRKIFLILARHKELGDTWEITHKGKSSIKLSSKQIQQRIL